MTHIEQMAEALYMGSLSEFTGQMPWAEVILKSPDTAERYIKLAEKAFSAIQPKIEGLVEALNIADEFVRSTKPRNPEEHEYISVDILHPIEKALESIKEWKL